jgi:hypothetical protein
LESLASSRANDIKTTTPLKDACDLAGYPKAKAKYRPYRTGRLARR